MSKPRIIAGSAKGRALDTPKRGTRPSPSRLREALFSILAFRGYDTIVDLYSGSGAIGLEAASRGWQATCVEIDRNAARVIRNNARELGLEPLVTVAQTDALRFSAEHPHSFGVVFAAPPYPLNLNDIFQRILDADTAAPGGLYIFQHPTNLGLTLHQSGVTLDTEQRRYGSNTLSLVSADSGTPGGAAGA